MSEIVYILTNEAMPGLVKIGRTNGELALRIRQLFQTGVPLPFELFFACEVANAAIVESHIHDAFGDHRVSRNREFFRIAPERIQSALQLANLREIRLGDEEVFETLEDKEDVAAAKRRTRFNLATVGIKAGTELILERDHTIKCVTINDVNKVEFQGQEMSLSAAAVEAWTSLGFASGSLSGPWAWTLGGKRLDDIRREIEEAID